MEAIFKAIEGHLHQNGLVDSGCALCGIAENGVVWNKRHDLCAGLEPLYEHLNIKALVFARPSQPYASIIDYLAQTATGAIRPQDCETRIFLHDLPIAKSGHADDLVPLLKDRKSVIIPGQGIISCSPARLEQAFVTYSSVCFACFVKFFTDFLADLKSGNSTSGQRMVFESIASFLDRPAVFDNGLAAGPFSMDQEIISAICKAGRKVVELRLVDSNFGNISYCDGNILYISETGSFLNSLKGRIVAASLNDSSPAPVTASSELPAHLQIVRNTGYRAILHGHPKFSVILSMDCDMLSCPHRGECHIRCSRKRDVCGIPIVSGEVGGGPHGLSNTVPKAIKEKSGVIVYGHGVFTADSKDFNGALKRLVDIENQCRIEYFQRVAAFF